MKWRKLGLVFAPDGRFPWMRTHASLPIALRLKGDIYRAYFASRDEQDRSHVGFVECDIKSPGKILYLSNEPVLTPGALGHFDDHGVYPGSLVANGGGLWMYYIGWNPGKRKPLFYSSIGLAVSRDMGRTFSRVSTAPIIGRSEFDPCLVTGPCVIKDGGLWRMWYVSGFKWEPQGDTLHSYYDVKYAESRDGITWNREGVVCIGHKPGERNISRPCVLKDGGVYRMWYSYNFGLGYRIGYAESADGYTWSRRDEEAGIDLSPEGWDSEALAYPWVFRHEGTTYMLYNGNEFGRHGFGLAQFEV